MKPLPANNGSALPRVKATWKRSSRESRLNAGSIFLRWRERVKRHGDNDELLAVVGYLDTSIVLMDLLSREAQPEAIKQHWPQLKRRLKTKRRLPLESRPSR